MKRLLRSASTKRLLIMGVRTLGAASENALARAKGSLLLSVSRSPLYIGGRPKLQCLLNRLEILVNAKLYWRQALTGYELNCLIG